MFASSEGPHPSVALASVRSLLHKAQLSRSSVQPQANSLSGNIPVSLPPQEDDESFLPAFFSKVKLHLSQWWTFLTLSSSLSGILDLLPDKRLQPNISFKVKAEGYPWCFRDPFPCMPLWEQSAVLVPCCRDKMPVRSNLGEEMLLAHSF